MRVILDRLGGPATRRRATIALATVVVVVGLLLFVRPMLALQAALERCGANDPANRVGSVFDVGRSADIRAFIPGLGDNPELEELQDEPATVVVFDGPTHLRIVGNPRGEASVPRLYDGVVCVVIGDFDIVYVDVDLSGLRTP